MEEITHSYGAQTQIPPAKPKTAALRTEAIETTDASPTARCTRYASFRVDLPEYLDQELTMRSARERATKTYLIMDALHRAGYVVRPEDLVADRRKTRFRHS